MASGDHFSSQGDPPSRAERQRARAVAAHRTKDARIKELEEQKSWLEGRLAELESVLACGACRLLDVAIGAEAAALEELGACVAELRADLRLQRDRQDRRMRVAFDGESERCAGRAEGCSIALNMVDDVFGKEE